MTLCATRHDCPTCTCIEPLPDGVAKAISAYPELGVKTNMRLDYFQGFEAGREASACEVDKCNHEGPYESIAAATRIRNIPTPPYKSGHVELGEPTEPKELPQHVEEYLQEICGTQGFDEWYKDFVSAGYKPDTPLDHFHITNVAQQAFIVGQAIAGKVRVKPFSDGEIRVLLGAMYERRRVIELSKYTMNAFGHALIDKLEEEHKQALSLSSIEGAG